MQIHYLPRIIFWTLIAAIVLVPLFVMRGVFFPYTFSKTILFYGLIEFAFALWLPLLWYVPQYRPRFSSFHITIGAFFLILVVASFVGLDASRSFLSGYERMMGVWTWVHLALFFVMLASISESARDWRTVFGALSITAGYVALYAVWQGVTSEALSVSTIGNAAFLASFLVAAFFLLLTFLFLERTISKRAWLFFGALLFVCGGIIFTEARAAVVGLGAGGTVFTLLFLLFGPKEGTALSIDYIQLKRIVGAGTLVLLLGAGGAWFFRASLESYLPSSINQLLAIDVTERTASGRVLAWRVAWEGFKERPILGWGPENFDVAFNTHYVPELYPQEPWFDRAHNILFDVGVTTGIVGLIAYMSIFVAASYVLIQLWRRNNISFWIMAGGQAFLVSYVAQHLFTFETITTYLVLMTGLAYIACQWTRVGQHAGAPFLLPIQKNKKLFGSVIISVLIVSLFFYTFNAKIIFANHAAHTGWETLRTGGGDDVALSHFASALSHNTFGSVDIRRFAAEYVFEFLKQGGNRPDTSLGRLAEYAYARMGENIAAEPHNVKWYMYRGELSSILASRFDTQFAEAMEADFKTAQELSPGRPQIYLELAEARKLQDDTTGAWKYVDHVTETVPNFAFGHLNAVVLAIEVGNAERERKEIAWLEEHGNLHFEALRDAYYKKERYAKAAAIQEAIVRYVALDPVSYPPTHRAVYWAHLAAIYEKAGEIEKARGAALQVLELDPNRKSEVEAFLQLLQ